MPSNFLPAMPDFGSVEAVLNPRAEDVYAADVACYPPAYRATRRRIDLLCQSFAEGVTLYRGRVAGSVAVLGYSAWHPFDVSLLGGPWPKEVPVDRGGEGAYVYNYSVVPACIGGSVARALMQRLDQQIAGSRILAADTVSEHGRRAARRWGMRLHEAREIDGAPWELWART